MKVRTSMFPKLGGISKRQQVFEAIRNCMANGTLTPGQRLVETDLAKQMHVATPTVREALIDLEHRGFVTRNPNQGTFVTKFTEEEVRQIYTVREGLEVIALRLARRQASNTDVEAVRQNLEAMRRAAQAVDRLAFYEADISFHRAIWDLSKNKYLVKTLEILVAPLFARVVTSFAANMESLCEVVDWHEKIMNCITQGSDEEVEEVIHGVMEALQRYHGAMLSAQGGRQEGPQQAEWTESSPLVSRLRGFGLPGG